MFHRSIKLKIVAALLVGVVGIALVCMALTRFVYERAMHAAAAQAVRNAQATFDGLERADVDKLAALLDGLVADERFKAAFVARDRERLQQLAKPLFDELRDEHSVTHWYFIDTDRTCFLRVHAPQLRGDRIPRLTLARAAEVRTYSAGKELGATAFALRVVKPLYDGDKLLGYYELAEEMDHFLARMKKQTGDDFGLLVDKDFLDAQAWARMRANNHERDDWGDRPHTVVVDSTTGGERLFDSGRRVKEVPDDGLVLDNLDRSLPHQVRGVFPVRDAYERKVGMVYVLHDTSRLHAGVDEVRVRVVAVVVLMALGLAALVVFLLEALVFDRLARMTAVVENLPARLQSGDYSVGGEIVPGPDDELGRFERFFSRFLDALGGTLRDLSGERDAARRRNGR
ncbi:cache domain-containing protein [Anaeromyxobacter paludicola]|uniref:Double Cache domain-containing protein n=1 Tax=Anaeromyxobacter paludicola TaxID=2918171 RepID=A0ABN6NDY1_9BACT|nr:cache domain-containing protein [Anaeromyxobacter paludicola]BDG10488.1 hypothetical protein AMPC_36010 [Anaeromyxobacter paludicola]